MRKTDSVHRIRDAQAAFIEVRLALRKIDAGRYGVCENCGKGIPESELRACPCARHCALCADRASSDCYTT